MDIMYTQTFSFCDVCVQRFVWPRFLSFLRVLISTKPFIPPAFSPLLLWQ